VAWPATRVARLLSVDYPIVQAPMAGGATTPELVAAVSEAGALGSLGAAVLPPDEIRAAIRSVRSLTERPFAVNLFAPLVPEQGSIELAATVNRALAPYRQQLGLAEPRLPAPPPDVFAAQLAVIVAEQVPVFSFTLGIPPLDEIRAAGVIACGTATTVAEAAALEEAGVDLIVAQGAEAGGHRATFAGEFDDSLVGGIALVPQIADRVAVPVLASGGIMDGRGIAAALALGAEGAQLGTAFLTCREAGTPAIYRQALHESADESTRVTRAYTGRPARAIRTPLIEDLERAGEALPFPLQAMLLADLRAAGAELGRADLLFLLAGQGSPLARDLSAGELVAALVAETKQVLGRLAGEE
jgi:nitronate monooxygenase